MKKLIKIGVAVLILAMTLSLCSCDVTELTKTVLGEVGGVLEDLMFRADYNFSDIRLTQKGINKFEISFIADSGNDDVEIYLSNSFSKIGNAEAEKVTKTPIGDDLVYFSFTKELDLAEDKYLWISCGDKATVASFTVPSAFPTVTLEGGKTVFHFNYTYDTDWGSFCDQKGKAVYYSTKTVFDDTAVLIEDNIPLGQEHFTLPDGLPENVYFFSVAQARNGKITNISTPVMHSADLLSEVTAINVGITNNTFLSVSISIPETSEIASNVVDGLQIMVKNGAADEIYVVDCSYAGGVATMLFDCTKLQAESIWYDVLVCWNGSVVVDVPTSYDSHNTVTMSEGKKDGVNYKITDWNSMLKVYFETEPKNANLIFDSYSISFDAETASLIANATLKEGVEGTPVLALTAGDKTQLISVKGVKNDDGSYTFTLPVESALTEAGKWYDVRFFIDLVAYETYKNDCISNENYSAKYENNGRIYDFQEWNNLLKLQFNYAS
jgi:hypothetical protein